MCGIHGVVIYKLERSVKDRKQIFNERTADVSKLHNIKLLAVATGGDYRQISSKSGGALCKIGGACCFD